MNTLSIRVRYRPLRIGFCVQKGNMDEPRRALQLTHAFWGDRFNPVIPVGTSEEDRRLAKSLVEMFQVDALYPLSAAESLQTFAKESPYHLPRVPARAFHGWNERQNSRIPRHSPPDSQDIRGAYQRQG